MYINPFTGPASSRVTPHASSQNSTSSPLDSTNTMFLQLLTTQLKNQSPLNPLDPDQFTTELVQFNMLDQLSQINSLLQSSTIAPAAPASHVLEANAASQIAKPGEN